VHTLKYLRFSLLFAIAIAGVLFGVSNQQQATVHFFWYMSGTYPLYLILFASFFSGTVVAVIYGMITDSEQKDSERKLEKHVQELGGLIKKTQAARTQPAGALNATDHGFF
jgi:uncharacterized integral membrane protein